MGKNKLVHALAQAETGGSQIHLRDGSDITLTSASSFGGRQTVFAVSVFCAFLALAALTIFIVIRNRRHSPPPLPI
jgi:hypothetical protein